MCIEKKKRKTSLAARSDTPKQANKKKKIGRKNNYDNNNKKKTKGKKSQEPPIPPGKVSKLPHECWIAVHWESQEYIPALLCLFAQYKLNFKRSSLKVH